MPTRRASAVWEGGLQKGKGSVKTESGAVDGQHSFGSRFESGKGTNPEELLAAAEAACFAMALSAALERAGTPATRLEASAACTIEKVADAFKITTMKLTVRATVPGATADAFQKTAQATKDACPVSGAIKGNVAIDLDAALV
jgi:osmotically inducible protein OsmC